VVFCWATLSNQADEVAMANVSLRTRLQATPAASGGAIWNFRRAGDPEKNLKFKKEKLYRNSVWATLWQI
jgi:hypothetical protein